MKALRTILALGLIWAAAPAVAEDIPAEVRLKLEAALQQVGPEKLTGEVTATAIEGLYQVPYEGGAFIFLTADGEYLISGELFKTTERGLVNLSEMARKDVREELLQEVDVADTIVFPAQGQRKAILNVFTDVDCGYCRLLHREVPELNSKGVEVRYLAFPRAGLGSGGYDKLATAWCASDQQQTLTDLKAEKDVPLNVCEGSPVAEQFALGERMGVRGTPALLLMDGTMLPGYQPAGALLERLGIN